MTSSSLKEFDYNVLHDEVENLIQALPSLGQLSAPRTTICAHFKKFSAKVQDIFGSLKEMKNAQIDFHLQRYFASTCLVSHLLRSSQPGHLKTSVSSLDTIYREGFAAKHETPLNYLKRGTFSWTQASLLIRHGGLGIIPASPIAETAYAGCH